jgi:4'-phosphopantetheinyl transferase EntD
MTPSWPLVLPLPDGGRGCVVLVPVPDARVVPEAVEQLVELLPVEEQALCAPWAPKRQATFAAGRQALRLALSQVGHVDVGVIARDDRGAPVLPPMLPGALRVSITHKDSVAGALVVADVENDVTVGVDLELDDGRARKEIDTLARHVLLPHELAQLPDDDDDARRRTLFERFSWKEALYKALDPFLRRYIGFTEVHVDVGDDRAVFGGDFFEHDGIVAAEGALLRVPALPAVVLTTARVRRRR